MNEYIFEQIFVGQKEFFEKTISLEMEDVFRKITGDNNLLHRDDTFACKIGNSIGIDKHVTFGMLTASMYSTLAGMFLPGKYSLIHSFDSLSFLKPVYAGDQLKISGEVVKKWEAFKLIQVKGKIENQNGEIVSKSKIKIVVLK